ncbi:MAG TPA: NTP transferase domain-containing protein [Fibrobacteria bacterium]|nr:NTP transferase domain-containing protein [Fibrobacteria bacterium]
MNRTVAIVQARIGSSRLPGKTLLHLRGHAIIDWILVRLSRCLRLDGIVLAIPEGFPDDLLAERAPPGIQIVRGPESDVVGRFALAAEASSATTIVRICADNPLVCPELVDQLVDGFLQSGADYGWNHVPRGNRFPDGLGAEICTRGILDGIHRDATAPGEREHLFNRIISRPEGIRFFTYDPLDPELAKPHLKLDVDTWEDYARLSRLELDIDSTAVQIVRTAEGDAPCA